MFRKLRWALAHAIAPEPIQATPLGVTITWNQALPSVTTAPVSPWPYDSANGYYGR